MIRLLTSFVISFCLFAAPLAFADDSRELTVDEQPLSDSLKTVADEFGLDIAFFSEITEGMEGVPLAGNYTPEEAFDELLGDTNLEYESLDNGTVVVRAKDEDDSGPGKSQPASNPVLMAQNQTSAHENQTSDRSQTTNDNDRDVVPLEEIIVVGSHIRGAESASPTLIFDRQEIEAAGFATLPDFIQSLPVNFGGGPTEGSRDLIPQSQGNINNANNNSTNGTGVNLHGQGSNATLVLLNGQRLSPADAGAFVDISMIPLNSIERVEVLTDGASALYGSDAIGGVVNVILRKDYEGAETRVRVGTAIDGDADEIHFAQSFGKNWNSGSAVIGYEYHERDLLDSSDRRFTADANDPTFLLPVSKRNSAFFNLEQDLTDRVQLIGNVIFSKRENDSTMVLIHDPTAVEHIFRESKQTSGTLGVVVDVSNTWRAELVGGYSENEGTGSLIQIFPTSPDIVSNSGTTTTVETVNFKADGALFGLPGGDVKMAVGGHFRNEDFSTKVSGLKLDREISAVFGELSIPIVGKGNSRPGIQQLDFTAAVRYEDYSDFGTTTDPKYGLIWSPVEGLKFRGSYGTSFRAPLLTQLVASDPSSLFVNLPNPSAADGSGDTYTMHVSSDGNPSLQPETATTTSFGFEIRPPSTPDFNLSLTYFKIEQEDKIESSQEFFGVFTSALAAPRITLATDPGWDPAFIAEVAASPRYFNATGIPGFGPPATFDQAEALFDARLFNIALVDTSGLDLNVTYGWDTDSGAWRVFFGGTYLFEVDKQPAVGVSPVEVLNTAFNPIDLKIRGGLSWSGNALGSSLFVNHIAAYKDNRFDPIVGVSSWTTVDLNLSYSPPSDDGFLKGTSISLNVRNLFDEDPPFVDHQDTRNLNFDMANASALGQTVALNFTKQW